MKYGLEGRTALVCGASRGLGYACAEALAEEGVALVLVARSAGPLEQAALQLAHRWGVQVTAVAADITEPGGRALAMEAAGQHAHRSAGAFDILVTNAGGPPAGDFRAWSTADWQVALNANMLTPIALMRDTVDGMATRGWGRIVNITSSTVKAPSPYLGLSNGSRAGLTGFVAGLARQMAPDGITINNLLPGTFDTDRLASNLAAGARQAQMEHGAYVEMRRKAVPAGRFGAAPEFGAACAFLCSRQAAYITAQNLLIDGGAYPGTL